jgi:hypothetical protein
MINFFGYHIKKKRTADKTKDQVTITIWRDKHYTAPKKAKNTMTTPVGTITTDSQGRALTIPDDEVIEMPLPEIPDGEGVKQ